MGSIDDWNFDDWVETIHLEKEDKNSLRKWLVKNRVVTKDQLRGLTEQDMTTLPSIGTKISLRLAIIDLCNTDVPIKVTVILPSEDKHGKLNQIHYKIKNQASLDSIMRQIKGHLSVGGLEALLEFSELQDGCTYQVISAHWTAIASGVKRNQIEDKVLEANSCLAVANPLSKENNFHLHSNVKFQKSNGQDEVVIDGVVVHTGGENTPSSSAYIISCTLSPQPKDIDSVLQQVELFKKHSPHHSHFKSVASNRVYPVLAGKFWSDVTINTLRMSPVPILCVMPSGLGYQVCKSFSTMIRRVV